MSAPLKRYRVLFVCGDDDGLRLDIDMSDPEEALNLVNANRKGEDGYCMRRIKIESEFTGLKDEFLIYALEHMSTGDIFRQLIFGYKRLNP